MMEETENIGVDVDWSIMCEGGHHEIENLLESLGLERDVKANQSLARKESYQVNIFDMSFHLDFSDTYSEEWIEGTDLDYCDHWGLYIHEDIYCLSLQINDKWIAAQIKDFDWEEAESPYVETSAEYWDKKHSERDAEIQSLSSQIKFLKIVAGINCDHISHITSLKFLDLSGCRFISDITALSGLTSLTSLDLSGCESLTDITALSGLTSLTSLDLSGCESLTDITALSGLTSLTSLNLSGCNSLREITALSGLTSLTSLNLSGCDSLRDITALSGLTLLTSLSLGGCESLTDITALSGLTSLTSLYLGGCESITDITTLSGLTSLTSLYLGACESITDITALSVLTSLTSLSLGGCESITDITAISDLTSLTSLYLGGCESITDITAISGLTSLTSLDLSDFQYVYSCKSLTNITISDLTSLTSLNLYGCKSLTVITLSGLTSLTSFDLHSNSSLIEISLSGFTSLSDLNLSGCGRLMSLSKITNATSLKKLNISDLKRLHPTETLEHLRSFTALEELDSPFHPSMVAELLAHTAVCRNDLNKISGSAREWLQESINFIDRGLAEQEQFAATLGSAFSLLGDHEVIPDYEAFLDTRSDFSATPWKAWLGGLKKNQRHAALVRSVERVDLVSRSAGAIGGICASLPSSEAPAEEQEWARDWLARMETAQASNAKNLISVCAEICLAHARLGLQEALQRWLGRFTDASDPEALDPVHEALGHWQLQQGDTTASSEHAWSIRASQVRDPLLGKLVESCYENDPALACKALLHIDSLSLRANLAIHLVAQEAFAADSRNMQCLIVACDNSIEAMAQFITQAHSKADPKHLRALSEKLRQQRQPAPENQENSP